MRTRRTFLAQAAMAGPAFGLVGCREPSPVAPFGVPPSGDAASAMLSAARRPEGVLELFFFGGLNPWDTFYIVPEYGLPIEGQPGSGRMWWSFQTGPQHPTIPEFIVRCGIQDVPLLQEFGRDGAGVRVHLGPFAQPLRDRPDLTARMRILVMRHEQAPHQTAVPLVACGHRFGSPRMAGTAAHVQRWFGDHDPRTAPHAVALLPDLYDVDDFNGEAVTATGLHPALARPLSLRLGVLAQLGDQLGRTGLISPAAIHDAAVEHYRQRAERRLTLPGHSQRVRARLLDDFAATRRAVAGAPELVGLFPPGVLPSRPGQRCQFSSPADQSAHGTAVATALLTHPQTPCRWVTSLDGGLARASAGMGYDTHAEHVEEGGRNVLHALSFLTESINRPGEGDPNKLDLDRHMVVLTTEFGRSPHIQFGTGLDHWPDGFVHVLLGGPISSAQAGIQGTIGSDGVATSALSPADFRAAMLLGQGIWPFAPEAFTGGDLSAGDDEIEAAQILVERVFGRDA